MQQNYIALAVPFFFVLIGAELVLARRRGRQVYRARDALTDLGCGITQQTVGLLFTAALIAGYGALYDRFRLFGFRPGSPVPWVIAFVGVSFFWAVHVVHHQSEDYNLAVALRQAVLSPVTTWPFFAPLALLGVPPLVLVAANSVSTLYQFWIHTELVGRLGPAEKVINTPSAHRVHHAVNRRYVDRNYGAIFIVWDRLFGSYEPEGEPCVYGLGHPLRSFNPLWAQVHYWVELWQRARRARSSPTSSPTTC
ncbi:MAG: sterol desaturase family protein [Myxococcaceae bacterium]